MPRPGLRHRILDRLAAAGGRIVTDDALLLAVYGDDEPECALNCVQVTICRIRRDLGRAAILRVRGVGYRMDAALAASWRPADARVIPPD
jgi:DNA-binding response OmpR family regulator